MLALVLFMVMMNVDIVILMKKFVESVRVEISRSKTRGVWRQFPDSLQTHIFTDSSER
jgi:hypothetical protein